MFIKEHLRAVFCEGKVYPKCRLAGFWYAGLAFDMTARYGQDPQYLLGYKDLDSLAYSVKGTPVTVRAVTSEIVFSGGKGFKNPLVEKPLTPVEYGFLFLVLAEILPLDVKMFRNVIPQLDKDLKAYEAFGKYPNVPFRAVIKPPPPPPPFQVASAPIMAPRQPTPQIARQPAPIQKPMPMPRQTPCGPLPRAPVPQFTSPPPSVVRQPITQEPVRQIPSRASIMRQPVPLNTQASTVPVPVVSFPTIQQITSYEEEPEERAENRQVHFTLDDHVRYDPGPSESFGGDSEPQCLMAYCTSEGEFVREQGFEGLTDAETLVASVTSEVPTVCSPYRNGEECSDKFHQDMKAIIESECNPCGVSLGNAYKFLRDDGAMSDLQHLHRSVDIMSFADEATLRINDAVLRRIFDSDIYNKRKYHRGDIVPASQFDKLKDELLEVIAPQNVNAELGDSFQSSGGHDWELKDHFSKMPRSAIGCYCSTRITRGVFITTYHS